MAGFRWRTTQSTFTPGKEGGCLLKVQECTHDGIFVARLAYDVAINGDGRSSGRWVLAYPDGRIHSQGDSTGMKPPMPDNTVLHHMAANPPWPIVITEWVEGSGEAPVVREFPTPEAAGDHWTMRRGSIESELEPRCRFAWRFQVEDRLARRSRTFSIADA